MKPINLSELTPAHATHPGEMLADELEARGIKQQEFAQQIGMQKSQLNEIIKGKRSMNAEGAVLVEAAIGISADFWLNAQNNYDLALVKIQSKVQERTTAIATWNMMKANVPVNYFKSQNLLSNNPVEDIETIKKIYKVNSLDSLAFAVSSPQFARFRKSEKLQEDATNMIGWVKYLEYQASMIEIKPFTPNAKDELIKRLREAIFENNDLQNKIENILNDVGIKIVYQQKAEKAAIDGYSFWSNENPAIGITFIHKRIDNFAFTLFHELGHIFLHLIHDKTATFLDLTHEEKDYKNLKEEKEADQFAQTNLIPSKEWEQFFTGMEVLKDEKILKFANKIKIHPAIIRGRICFEFGHYGFGKSGINYSIG
jgi:HTH-type transcriptional regulator / antitoxin HigA